MRIARAFSAARARWLILFFCDRVSSAETIAGQVHQGLKQAQLI